MKKIVFFILVFIILSCNCGQIRKDNIDNYLKIGIKFNINKEYVVNNIYKKPVLYKMNDSILIYKIDTYYIELDPYSYYIKEVNNIK